jgi:hypothetical protein
VYLRNLGVHALVGSINVYRVRPLIYLAISFGIVIIYDLIVLLVAGHRPFGHSLGNFSWLSASRHGVGVLMLVPVAAAVDAYVVVSLRGESNTKLAGLTTTSFKILPMTIFSQAVAYLFIGVAGMFFVLPGLILWLRWFIIGPVVAVEKLGIVEAFKHSWALTASHYWHVLTLLLVSWFVVLATVLGVQAIVAGSGVDTASVMFECVAQGVVTSYLALAMAVFYLDLRVGLRVGQAV